MYIQHFFSSIRKGGFGCELLGAELLPKAGFNQTLNTEGFDTSWCSSFRRSTARIFYPKYKSQLKKK
ncbi:MAG: hypothetical protein ACJA17_000318 [Polaribacter sp.]|jgi:hypothetical protein